MNIKRIGLCILALIVVGLSYWLAVGGNYDSKTVRIDPEEHTLVNSSDAIISKRILAMKSIDSQVYFLGYEGYGIYNLADNTLRLMPITFRGQHIEPPKTENYQRGLREITMVKTFSDFSGPEQSVLKDLLESTDRGAHYYGDFYHSGYESSLIDMKDQYFITNTVRALKRINHTLYVYDASGFIIIDLDSRRIQGFFNNRLGGEGPKGVPDSLRGHYGSDFTMIYALSKLDPKYIMLWSIIVGGFIGFVAGRITKKAQSMGIILRVIAGLVGASVGQALLGTWGPSLAGMALIPSIVGAVIVIAVVSFFTGRD